MPKIPAKFEDWTPPWGEDEIDADKVARLVYNLQFTEQTQTSELRKLKTENEELTNANEVFKTASEEATKSHDDATQKAVAEVTAKLEKERDQARDDLAKTKREADLLKVQVEFPVLEEDDLKRLVGDNLDDLLEDAEKLATRLAPAKVDDEQEQEQDEISLRRQPRVRTPGDPSPGDKGGTDVNEYLKQRSAQSAWVS